MMRSELLDTVWDGIAAEASDAMDHAGFVLLVAGARPHPAHPGAPPSCAECADRIRRSPSHNVSVQAYSSALQDTASGSCSFS